MASHLVHAPEVKVHRNESVDIDLNTVIVSAESTVGMKSTKHGCDTTDVPRII